MGSTPAGTIDVSARLVTPPPRGETERNDVTVDALMPIGELARRAEIPVKTLRHYSDIGIVPPAHRTDAGYRMYGEQERLRLETVKTLRRLGFGLDEITDMLADHADRQSGLRRQLQAVRARLRDLRRVAVVLGAALERDEPAVVHLARLQTLAQLSAAEHGAPTDGRGDAPHPDDDLAGPALPDLPDDAVAEQRAAWLELVELLAEGASAGRPTDPAADAACPLSPGGDLVGALHDAMEARSAGISPDDPRADRIVERLRDAYGGDPVRQVIREAAPDGDLERRRYWRLVARVRGWPEHSPQAQALDWLVAALRLRCV